MRCVLGLQFGIRVTPGWENIACWLLVIKTLRHPGCHSCTAVPVPVCILFLVFTIAFGIIFVTCTWYCHHLFSSLFSLCPWTCPCFPPRSCLCPFPWPLLSPQSHPVSCPSSCLRFPPPCLVITLVVDLTVFPHLPLLSPLSLPSPSPLPSLLSLKYILTFAIFNIFPVSALIWDFDKIVRLTLWLAKNSDTWIWLAI